MKGDLLVAILYNVLGRIIRCLASWRLNSREDCTEGTEGLESA